MLVLDISKFTKSYYEKETIYKESGNSFDSKLELQASIKHEFIDPYCYDSILFRP